VRSLWAKGLSSKDIHKEMFPVYAGCVCRVKRFRLAGKRFADAEEVETDVRKRLRQQPKDFGALVKRWDGCIDVGGGYVEKYKCFSRFEYHMFCVLFPFVAHLLTLPRITYRQLQNTSKHLDICILVGTAMFIVVGVIYACEQDNRWTS
jgi:hypothetical protein